MFFVVFIICVVAIIFLCWPPPKTELLDIEEKNGLYTISFLYGRKHLEAIGKDHVWNYTSGKPCEIHIAIELQDMLEDNLENLEDCEE